jgi:ABC-type multidrug transport system ATPase subunit
VDTVLEATALTKDYEDFGIRGVSLTVRSGSISGIFGPNVAGRTTPLKVLAARAPARSGKVRLFGQTYETSERDLKNRVGYVPQEPTFDPDKTAAQGGDLAPRATSPSWPSPARAPP